jgi:hypothetical protein
MWGRNMVFLKLQQRYLNLDHVTSVVRQADKIEVVTPYEVLRLTGEDAACVLQALEQIAGQQAEGDPGISSPVNDRAGRA